MKLNLLFAAVIIIAFASCSKEYSINPTSPNDSTSSNAPCSYLLSKFITTNYNGLDSTNFIYDNNNRLIGYINIMYDSSTNVLDSITYNSAGQLTGFIDSYNFGSHITLSNLTYSGNKITQINTLWDKGQKSIDTTQYELSNGKLVKMISSDNDVVDTTILTYDANGNVVQSVTKSACLLDTTRYTYNTTYLNPFLPGGEVAPLFFSTMDDGWTLSKNIYSTKTTVHYHKEGTDWLKDVFAESATISATIEDPRLPKTITIKAPSTTDVIQLFYIKKK